LGIEGNWEGKINPLPENLLLAIREVEQLQFDFQDEIRSRNALVSLSESCDKLQAVRITVLSSDGDLSWFDVTIQKLLYTNCRELQKVEIQGKQSVYWREIK
jgi:hypothetical protein